MKQLPEIKSMTFAELKQALQEKGQPPYRARQIFRWLHKGISSFDEMMNLPKDLRGLLKESFFLTVPIAEQKQVSALDGTIKYLWKLWDGNCVESVLMQYEHGNSACVSTQVGCRMGCAFCASGLEGLVRHLSAGEILDQVLFMQKESGRKIQHLVLMGTGEPLDNYNNVLQFIRLLGEPDGIHIGQRHISLSTCGLADKIDALAQEGLQLTLSISLHAPDNKSRNALMPINRRFPIERLMASCRNYFQKTGRRISYEYTMIEGASDSPQQAEKLAGLLKGMPAHVNLIPLNHVTESSLKPSPRRNIERFRHILEQNGITVTVRRRLGRDIDAACGQLRRRAVQGQQ